MVGKSLAVLLHDQKLIWKVLILVDAEQIGYKAVYQYAKYVSSENNIKNSCMKMQIEKVIFCE